MILDVTFGSIRLCRFLLQKSFAVLSVKPATASALLDFGDRIVKQFPHLERDGLCKGFLFLEQQLRQRVQKLGAFGKIGSTIFSECLFGTCQPFFDFLIAEWRKFFEFFTCGGIDRSDWH